MTHTVFTTRGPHRSIMLWCMLEKCRGAIFGWPSNRKCANQQRTFRCLLGIRLTARLRALFCALGRLIAATVTCGCSPEAMLLTFEIGTCCFHRKRAPSFTLCGEPVGDTVHVTSFTSNSINISQARCNQQARLKIDSGTQPACID